MRNAFQQQILHLLQAWVDGGAEHLKTLDPRILRPLVETVRGGVDKAQTHCSVTHSRDNQQWLNRQGLMPIMASLLSQQAWRAPDPESGDSPAEALRQKRLGYLCHDLYLEASACDLAKALNAWGKPWAIIKGFALARRVYPQSFMRLCGDIDILVRPEDQRDALNVLYAIGGKNSAQNIQPHEQTVIIKGVSIDIHNAPMRKGRLRFNPTPDWLSRTQRVDIFPCLSEHDELVLSLIHPAVTEYLVARVVRMLDIFLQIKRNREAPDWPRVADDILRLGLANAAYATALCVNDRFAAQNDPIIPRLFLDRLQVGWIRQRYWRFWLTRQPDRLYAASPLLAQLLFSLWLNDSPRDWVRALVDKGTERH